MSVELDGATYWRAAGGLRVADGQEGLVAVWFEPDAVATGALLLTRNSAATTAGWSLSLSSGNLAISGRNSADTVILNLATTGAGLVAGTWYLALASWNLATGSGHFYVNDTDRTSLVTATDDTLDYTRGEWWVGAMGDASDEATLPYDGALAYVYFATTYLDISVEANRRFFIGDFLEQIGLGWEARKPLSGVRPEIFLAGGAGNFGRNLGSAGDLAAYGAPTNSSGRPASVETLSRGFRGEKWRESERSGIPFSERDLVFEPATGLVVGRREYSTDRDEIRRGRHHRNLARG